MTPAARLQAAIELFSRVADDTGAADRTIAEWFRSRRYAGAKDRRSVTDLVYAALRRRGELAWRIHHAGLDPEGVPGRRLTVLAASAGSFEEVHALCDGSRFGPPPLSDSERMVLAGLLEPMPPDLPDPARYNYPDWLDASLRARFGHELTAALQALDQRAPVDIRINGLKCDRAAAQARLAADHIGSAPTQLSPIGLRLEGRPRLDDHDLVRSGWIEPQDEAAQIASLLVAAAPGMQVIDYCAGAGGKTLALAAGMRNRGQIYACDPDQRKLDRLMRRVQRAGARNVQVHVLSSDNGWLTAIAGRADRVLVDAPCSGTGTWRRNPEARWKLTPALLAEQIERQRDVLDSAAQLVRPGGRLIYVTCSVLREEDESQAEAFLSRYPDFRLVPIPEIWPAAVGGACPTHEPSLVLLPHRHGTDGFFVAVFERQETA